jgi:hypothetical protein
MGTRSTVKFCSQFNSNKVLVAIYHQFDGYITGLGHDLANWLKGKKIITGIIESRNIDSGYANGMGCLAAQYIAEHKTEIGSVYITTIEDKQEYNYKVMYENNDFIIEVEGFRGTVNELLNTNNNLKSIMENTNLENRIKVDLLSVTEGLQSNKRRAGNTTKLINKAIDIIFNGDICVAKDDYLEGKDAHSNQDVFNMILKRLEIEHRCSFRFDIEKDVKNLEIWLNLER